MAQINYRAYVIDTATGENGIWFLGTLLGGWAYLVPRLLWKMPWHKGSIDVRWQSDEASGLYSEYAVTSDGDGSPVVVELTQDTGTEDGADAGSSAESFSAERIHLPGFPDVETGLVCLTHPLQGFFRRRDGRIGINRVWHRRIPVRPARLLRASFPFLERTGFVARDAQAAPYSVLLAPAVEFFSRLPPRIVAKG